MAYTEALDPDARRTLQTFRVGGAVAVVVVLALAAGFVFVAHATIAGERAFDRNAARTVAHVDDVCVPCHKALIQFTTAEGEKVVTELSVPADRSVAVGTALEVEYDPVHPAHAEAPALRVPVSSGIVPIAALLVLIAFPCGFVLARCARRMVRATELVATTPGTQMRVVTWVYCISSRGGGARRTGAVLYPLECTTAVTDEAVGAVVVDPQGPASRIQPWSVVEVFGDVRPGGVVAFRYDGRVYLPRSSVKRPRWAGHNSFRPPVGLALQGF